MPVIINEFEIITEPREPEPAPQATPGQAADQPPRLQPEDIVRIERHQRARLERVRAD